MADQWTLHGVEFENCPCAWGCPCQFGAQPTYGRCEALMGGHIEEGNFNDTNLDGLDWAMLLSWPGPVPEGNGTQQAIIDERANPTQREALRKILHGESTTPGATVFFVYNKHDVDCARDAVRTHRTVDRCRSANGQHDD